MMYKLLFWAMASVVMMSSSTIVVAVQASTTDDVGSIEDQQQGTVIIQREMDWAEHSMEGYKRRKNELPLRSSIRAAHVHSEDWVHDSVEVINHAQLRGRSKKDLAVP